MSIPIEQWQLAYLAGLIDGEGSVECQKETAHRGGATARYSIRLSFVFATKEPLATISRWLGVPVKEYPARDATRSSRHRMHIPKGIAVPLLREMLPFLILKRSAAELVIAIEETRAKHSPSRTVGFGLARRMPTEAIAEMNVLYLRLRALKSNKRRMDARIAA